MVQGEQLAVAVWGTGHVGQACIRLVQSDPRMRLSGVVVHDAAKDGRDAGELAGIQPLGVAATRAPEHGLAGADAVIHATRHDPERNCEELCSALSAGVNAVTTAGFVFPFELFPTLARRLDEIAIAHGVSVHGTGVNPGFCMDVLPLTLSSVTNSVERIWCDRVTEMSHRVPSWISSASIGRQRRGCGARPWREIIWRSGRRWRCSPPDCTSGWTKSPTISDRSSPSGAARRTGTSSTSGACAASTTARSAAARDATSPSSTYAGSSTSAPELDPFADRLVCEVTGQPSVFG